MDSQAVDHLLMAGNTAAGVRAESAYRSEEIEAKLPARGLKSCIHRKGKRPSRDISYAMRCRAVVEHVFGAQTNDMGDALGRVGGIPSLRLRFCRAEPLRRGV